MRIITLVFLLVLTCTCGYSQESRRIGDFNKLVVSPHINVVLIKGDNTSVKVESTDVDDDKIIVDTDNDVLNIYLEGAKYHNKYEKNKEDNRKWKEDIYKDVQVTAYVTYDYLEAIQVRGEQFVKSDDKINQNSLKITLYGEVDMDLQSVSVRQLKITLYGENEIKINNGKVNRQVIKCYGENQLNLFELQSEDIKSTLYGENSLKVNANGEIKVTAFGESKVKFRGDAYINKGLIIGDTDIKRLKD